MQFFYIILLEPTTAMCVPPPLGDLVLVGEACEYVIDVLANVEQTLASVQQLICLGLWCVWVTKVLQWTFHSPHTVLALYTQQLNPNTVTLSMLDRHRYKVHSNLTLTLTLSTLDRHRYKVPCTAGSMNAHNGYRAAMIMCDMWVLSAHTVTWPRPRPHDYNEACVVLHCLHTLIHQWLGHGLGHMTIMRLVLCYIVCTYWYTNDLATH